MSTIMAIIKALYPVMILGFIVPVILCDSTHMSGKSNAIDDNTNNEITKFDKNLVPQYSVDHSLVDNSFISSLYQQEVCRRNMVNMVYELCRPYFRAGMPFFAYLCLMINYTHFIYTNQQIKIHVI